MMQVEIDPHSGFCGGVIRAIGTAEKFLSDGGRLSSLGSIVHNEEELARLGAMGLRTLSSLDGVQEAEGEILLIRAHGEPPQVYERARALGFELIDCTCPVVLRLQQSIRQAYSGLNGGGRLVIFGKIGHPEVLGLVGQVGGDALVVENVQQLRDAIAGGEIPSAGTIELFSQTTKSPSGYKEVQGILNAEFPGRVNVHETICSQVASRHEQLSDFARGHDVIVFVAGSTSSNGKVLLDLCRACNSRSHHVSDPSALDPAWFHDGDRVGVCGATSTPRWLLEKVASAIENLQ